MDTKDESKKLALIRKKSEYRANPSKATIRFNSNIYTDSDYDYTSPDNYLESKRAAGWFGGKRR